jgi:hypothetical protein
MDILRRYQENMKNIPLSSFKNFCQNLKIEIYKRAKSINTLSTYLSLMNSWIGKNLGIKYYNISKNILKPDSDDKMKQMKTQKDGYVAKLKDRIPIDVKIYMALIEKYKTSKNYYELVACVNLATGRRLIEIISTGSFEKIDDHYVKFKGQAKTRDKDNDNIFYKIPIIFLYAEELIDIMKKLRSMKKPKNTVGASTRLEQLYKKAFKREGITSEVIRGAYVNICYRLYGHERMSLPLYGNLVLGHKTNDLSTFTLNYDRVYLINTENII